MEFIICPTVEELQNHIIFITYKKKKKTCYFLHALFCANVFPANSLASIKMLEPLNFQIIVWLLKLIVVTHFDFPFTWLCVALFSRFGK